MSSRSRRWVLALVVAGVTMGSTGASAQTATEEWVARYNDSTGAGDREIAHDIAVDGNGNVYVTGETESAPGPLVDYDYATVKYDVNGNELWAATYDGGFGHDRAYAVTVDDAGNVYVTGESDQGAATGSDYVTIKYDSS